MKLVIISIQPKWCEKICRKIGEANGLPVYLKIEELRKSAPKEVPFTACIYCTNSRFDITDIDNLASESVRIVSEGRGKVIGEFVCDKVNYYPAHSALAKYSYKDTGVNAEEFIKYSKGKDIYGWHISYLKIYDKPRELSEFRKPDEPFRTVGQVNGHTVFMDGYKRGKPLTRAPQSWMYVEEVQND